MSLLVRIIAQLLQSRLARNVQWPIPLQDIALYVWVEQCCNAAQPHTQRTPIAQIWNLSSLNATNEQSRHLRGDSYFDNRSTMVAPAHVFVVKSPSDDKGCAGSTPKLLPATNIALEVRLSIIFESLSPSAASISLFLWFNQDELQLLNTNTSCRAKPSSQKQYSLFFTYSESKGAGKDAVLSAAALTLHILSALLPTIPLLPTQASHTRHSTDTEAFAKHPNNLGIYV